MHRTLSFIERLIVYRVLHSECPLREVPLSIAITSYHQHENSRLKFVCKVANTVWLQISVVEYFRDFREFSYDHENFCYEIFLTAASSTALDTSKSRKTSESRKSGKITKV